MMESDTTAATSIPLSRKKLLWLVLISVLFVAASAWLWSIADVQTQRDPLFVKIVAVIGVAFATIGGIYACLAACDSKPGLIIDQTGLVDNSSGVSAGRIFWHEIVGLRITEMGSQRLLTIDVVDPLKFINRGGYFRRMLNAANARMVGSPINISPTSLAIDFDELVRLVSDAYEQAQLCPPLERDELS